ncbi:hypothetical protein [Streptomyces sp. NPDC055186]
MQLPAVGVAGVAAVSLMVMVVNWLIARWWVLVVAVLVPLLGGLGWWRHRTRRVQWQQVQARVLCYGLAQLDVLTHRRFEHAVRDLMHRDGRTDAVPVGGRGRPGRGREGHRPLRPALGAPVQAPQKRRPGCGRRNPRPAGP